MSQGPAIAPRTAPTSLIWNENTASWAADLERAITALMTKKNRLPDTNLTYLVRTALTLNEAIAAVRMKGQLVDGDTIMSIIALTGSSSAVAWEGVAIFRLAQFIASRDPAEALSETGIYEALRRLDVYDPQIEPDPAETALHPGPRHSKGTVIDACRELRRLWMRIPDIEAGHGLTVARMMLAPLFSQVCGYPLVFFGSALGPAEARQLREAMRDEEMWMSALMPVLARATQRSDALVVQLLALRTRWLKSLTHGKFQASHSGLDTVFVQPILSTANMISLQERLTGKAPSLRTAQSWMTNLQNANIVTRIGKEGYICRAKDPCLMGRDQ